MTPSIPRLLWPSILVLIAFSDDAFRRSVWASASTSFNTRSCSMRSCSRVGSLLTRFCGIVRAGLAAIWRAASRAAVASPAPRNFSPVLSTIRCSSQPLLSTATPATAPLRVSEAKAHASIAPARKDCDVCELKARCCPNAVARKIPRDLHEDARDVARALATTPEYEAACRRRKESRDAVRPSQAHPSPRTLAAARAMRRQGRIPPRGDRAKLATAREIEACEGGNGATAA